MHINEDTLYNIALGVLFILILVQLYNMYYKKEHMEGSMVIHQYVDWPGIHDRNHIPPPQYQEPKFYLDDDDVPRSPNQELTNPIPVEGDISCGPHFNWLVPQSLGAGNRYDDMLWAKTSPKNVLKDDCMACKKFSGDKVFDDNVSGLPSMGGSGLLE